MFTLGTGGKAPVGSVLRPTGVSIANPSRPSERLVDVTPKHSVSFASTIDTPMGSTTGHAGPCDDGNDDGEGPNILQQRPHLIKRGFTLVPERLGKGMHAEGEILLCERLMKLLTFLLIVITFPGSLFFCMKVIAQYERAVVFRLGRLLGIEARGPGLILVVPCLDSMKRVDLRTFTFDVPTQEVLTKDSVTVAVDAVVYYRIFDPVMSVVNVEDANRSTRLLAQTTLRNVLGTVDLYQVLTAREEIAALMQECLDAATDTWGVKVERVEIKDVRLPTQLQRAMAAEAEAAREARAKVIMASGEQRASKALKAAAIEISKCPIALQLRYLQTLNSISAEKNSTIIFPVPIDILKHFHRINMEKKAAEEAKMKAQREKQEEAIATGHRDDGLLDSDDDQRPKASAPEDFSMGESFSLEDVDTV